MGVKGQPQNWANGRGTSESCFSRKDKVKQMWNVVSASHAVWHCPWPGGTVNPHATSSYHEDKGIKVSVKGSTQTLMLACVGSAWSSEGMKMCAAILMREQTAS